MESWREISGFSFAKSFMRLDIHPNPTLLHTASRTTLRLSPTQF